ncbi:MAG: hypothetical protein ACI8RD_008438 [Bacillariaceae sp.]|jgi:hypothetical protein
MSMPRYGMFVSIPLANSSSFAFLNSLMFISKSGEGKERTRIGQGKKAESIVVYIASFLIERTGEMEMGRRSVRPNEREKKTGYITGFKYHTRGG